MREIKKIVADAGLLLPEAGTVGLDKFQVDQSTWVVERRFQTVFHPVMDAICTSAQIDNTCL